MKKIILTVLCLSGVLFSKAQLSVDSLGRVNVNNNTSILGRLSVNRNSNYSGDYAASFSGGQDCVIIYNEGQGTPRTGLYIYNTPAYNQASKGVFIDSNYGTTTNKEIYGIHSIAGSSTKENYGVLGCLRNGGITKGAGIFGSVIPIGFMASQYEGIYAGYFYGDVRVTGSIYGTLLTPSSNSKSATNEDLITKTFDDTYILSTDSDELISNKLQNVQLLQLRRSSYDGNFSAEELAEQESFLCEARHTKETSQTKDYTQTESSYIAVPTEAGANFKDKIGEAIPQTKLASVKYGLAADQLKEVFPELVYEDENGNVSINYIEMIPLLVQAVNEVKRENAALSAEIAELKGEKVKSAPIRYSMEEASMVSSVDDFSLVLSQNTPNPFSSSTDIEVSVPSSVSTAILLVHDMNGKQIKRVNIPSRGVSHISVTSEGLTEGIYIYSLLANGKVVATKKMI